MLYNFDNLFKSLNKKINGVLHIGAHEGQEKNDYIKSGLSNIIFIEANDDIFNRLSSNCHQYKDIKCHNLAISDKNEEEAEFYVTSNDSASSSLLKLKVHAYEYPEIKVTNTKKVKTRTIDSFLEENKYKPDHYNFLNMDIQGAELMALKGATNYLKTCDIIYTEVNFDELYENCGIIDDLEDFLRQYNFVRHSIVDTGRRWGDAVYIKV